MKRDNHRVQSIFEILGAYFIDYYFNQLFLKSRKIFNLQRGNATQTDIYISLINDFARGVHTDKCYTTIIKQLQKYFQENTKHNMISLKEMRNEIIKTMIPAVDYFESMRESQKDTLLHRIICDTISKLTTVAARAEKIRLIFDNRKIDGTARLLQDCCIDEILYPMREEMFYRFTAQNTGASETVPIAIAQKLRDENKTLQIKVKQMTETLRKASEQLKVQQRKIAELQKSANTCEHNSINARPEPRKYEPPPQQNHEHYETALAPQQEQVKIEEESSHDAHENHDSDHNDDHESGHNNNDHDSDAHDDVHENNENIEDLFADMF